MGKVCTGRMPFPSGREEDDLFRPCGAPSPEGEGYGEGVHAMGKVCTGRMLFPSGCMEDDLFRPCGAPSPEGEGYGEAVHRQNAFPFGTRGGRPLPPLRGTFP